jgi:sirohydrochlorin ferrochelatase
VTAPEVEEVAQRPFRDSGARLVTVAHGTRTAAGNQVAVEITAAAGRRLGVEATASYVELCEPLFVDVMAQPYDGRTVVVPTLLSTGVHVRRDLPAAVSAGAAPDRVGLGGPLGPDPLLAGAQVARLREAGAADGQPVVLVAAGSTDPDAMADLAGAVDALAEAWSGPVRLATLAGLGPRPAEVVQPGDAVSPYLLATGFFHRRLREESLAVGAAVVADVIGPHPLVVELLVERARGLGLA